jgi:predicted metal-dependent hydrolase
MSGAPEAAAAVRRGIRLFNRGRYLTAQQLFEETWREAEGADQAALEAFVQLSAGLHLRTRRGAMQGAEHLIVRALVTLEEHQPVACGVDVTRLLEEFNAYLRWLREVKRPHRLLDGLRIPRIPRA